MPIFLYAPTIVLQQLQTLAPRVTSMSRGNDADPATWSYGPRVDSAQQLAAADAFMKALTPADIMAAENVVAAAVVAPPDPLAAAKATAQTTLMAATQVNAITPS